MSSAPISTATPPPAAPSPGRRAPAAWVAARRYARVAPASVALAGIVLVTSILTGTLWMPATADGGALVWAAGVSTTIHAGYWWTPLTALFVPEDPVQVVVCVLLALTLLAVAERLLGTIRVVVAFLVTGVLGIALGVLGQWAAADVGGLLAHATGFDFTLDPSIGVLGALVTASAFASALWRRRIRLLTFTAVLLLVLYNGDQNNVFRLIAALLGLGLGVLLRRDGVYPLRRSSHAETRTLVSAVVAVTALAPLAALLPPGGFGPFSFLASLFQHPAVDVANVLSACAASDTSNCREDLARVSVQGLGPLLLSLLPLVLLLVTAIGLRRGRHFALLLGMVVNAGLVVLPFTALPGGDVAVDIEGVAALAAPVQVLLWLLAALLPPLASIALLVVTRRQFPIRAPRDAVVRFTILVVVSFALLGVAYLVAGLATLTSYVPEAGIGDVFASTLRRFVPAGFESVLGPVIVPTSTVVILLFQWVGPVFWLIFVLGTLRLYRATSTGRTLGDELRFRELLQAGGGGTLGFLGTWPDNVYWFAEEGDAAVAYRVVDGVAIALSDPVCHPARAERTIIEFVGFCEANSWTPVFYSAHAGSLPVFESLGWQSVPVGEETRVAAQHVRPARGPAGLTTQWTTWDSLAPLQQTQIAALSEQWVSEKGLPELGFTLGGMAELRDADVRLLLAVDAAGDLQAVSSWLPCWREDRVTGYTLDFVRRVDGSDPGILEALLVAAARRLREEGVETLGLTRSVPGSADGEPAGMDRLLALLAETLEPATGIAALSAFAGGLDPERETLWMAFPDAAALPAVGSAVARAYLPEAGAKEFEALAKAVRG